MIWLVLAVWLVVLGLALGFAWYRAARTDAGQRPGTLPLFGAASVVIAAGVLYAALGMNPETQQWISDYHAHKDDVLTLLTPEPDPSVQSLPLPLVTRVMQRAATQDPSGQAWYGVSMLYSELDGAPQAVQAARKAVEMTPGEFGPRLLLARSLIDEADGRLVPEARQLLEELLAEEPEHDGAWMLTGMAAMRSGDYDLAIRALDSLLSRHESEEAAVPLRRARARAVAMRENRARLDGLTVRVEAADSLVPGGTLFVFLRRRGEEGGQPLAAVRVLADAFPVEVTVNAEDWLQSLPGPDVELVAGARYAPGPGSAVDQASIEAEPRPLERRSGALRTTLQLR